VAHEQTQGQHLITGRPREAIIGAATSSHCAALGERKIAAEKPNLNSVCPSWMTACAVFMRAKGKSMGGSLPSLCPTGS
jgi:hypothetical protein